MNTPQLCSPSSSNLLYYDITCRTRPRSLASTSWTLGVICTRPPLSTRNRRPADGEPTLDPSIHYDPSCHLYIQAAHGSRAGGDDRGELFHSLLRQRRAIRHSWDQVRLVHNGRARQARFWAVFDRERMPWNRLSSQECGNAEVVALTTPQSNRPWPARFDGRRTHVVEKWALCRSQERLRPRAQTLETYMTGTGSSQRGRRPQPQPEASNSRQPMRTMGTTASL